MNGGGGPVLVRAQKKLSPPSNAAGSEFHNYQEMDQMGVEGAPCATHGEAYRSLSMSKNFPATQPMAR